MRKILLLLGIIAISMNSVYAADCGTISCSGKQKPRSVTFSTLTGMNFFAEKIGNAVIKHSIKKESQGIYKVNLQSYNLSALKKGIFKSLEIKGKDTVTDGIYISNMKLKTICNYNHIEIDNKYNVAIFQEPFAMGYAFQFTEDDLNKTMKSGAYKEMIRKVNSIGNANKLFNISSTSAKIQNSKLYYTIVANIPLLKLKQSITVETDMKARSGQIVLNDTRLVTDTFSIDMSKLDKILNYLNPLEFAMNVFDDEYAKAKIEEITIKDNTINLSGIFTIDAGTETEL